MQNSSPSVPLAIPLTTSSVTLFDRLPLDTLSIIVQQTNILLQKTGHLKFSDLKSDDPRPYKLGAHGTVRFLALLFSENSPLRDAAATLVSEIELKWFHPGTSIDCSKGRLTIGRDVFEGAAEEMELARIMFSACGPYVRKTIVRCVPRKEANASDFVERFTAHVFRYCRNVKEVMFWGYRAPLTRWGTASSFFREYGANLRKIEWDGEEDEQGFLDLQKCVNTRWVTSLRMNTSTLISLLKACGSTVEELIISIKPAADSANVVQALQKNCKQLSVLYIRNSKDVLATVGQESYSSLLRSYGSHLKHANIDGLDHEHLVTMVKACTNLGVTVSWMNEASADCRLVCDLGPRVKSLIVDANYLYGEVYPRAFEQCSNLQELDMSGNFDGVGRGVTDEIIANVFAPSRFPKLEHLSIPNFRADERNMALIASCTANLKSAFFLPFECDSEASGFPFIADSNKHLKEIVLEISSVREVDRRAESALEWASELVKTFRKCRKLRFEISWSHEGELKGQDLMRVCKVLPCRDVDVYLRIDSVEYQYPKQFLGFASQFVSFYC